MNRLGINIFSFLYCIYFASTSLSAQNISALRAQLHSDNAKERLDALLQLNIHYNDISLDTALMYGRQALNLSKHLDVDSLIMLSHFRLCVSFHHQSQLDSIIEQALAANRIGKERADTKAQAFSYKMLAIAYRKKENIDKAIEYSLKGIDISQSRKDTFGIASTYGSMANIYQENGQYEEALHYNFLSDQLYEAIGDLEGRSSSAVNTANVYLDLDNTEKALQYLYDAQQYIHEDSFPKLYAFIADHLGNIYNQVGNLDSALFFYQKSLTFNERVGDLEGVTVALNNMGKTYIDKQEWQTSNTYLQRSYKLAVQIGIPNTIAHSLKNLGIYHEAINQRDSAAYFYDKGLATTQEYNLPFIEEILLERSYTFYKKNQQFKKALEFHEKYLNLINETKSLETEKQIARLETQYESEKQQRAIEKLELLTSVQQSKVNVFRLSLLSLTIVATLIILGILYKKRNEKKLFEAHQRILEKEKSELDQALVFKTKQLTSHALHMVQKNKVLQELKQDITTIAPKVNTEEKKALKALIRRINTNIQSDEEWATFKLYFEQTNQNFYKNLSKINSKLSPTELKLCALIKLNMNIKETASILNIEPTSVKTARHRLRKKLDLEHGEDLPNFIRSIT